jgi:hypothetical protein
MLLPSYTFCFLFSDVQKREKLPSFVTTQAEVTGGRHGRPALCQPHKLLVNLVEKEVCRSRVSYKYLSASKNL